MKLGTSTNAAGGDGELPLTSLIDVIFLLLIFFMVTSSMSVPEAQLASALQVDRTAAGRASDLQPQIVHVEMRDGRAAFRLGERVFFDKRELTSLLSALPKEGGVFVRVSDAVPVEAAAAALQASKDAGFSRVSYVPAG